jgi:hypothetical protein
MRPHAAETVLLASSLLFSSTGCSYAFVHGPPAQLEPVPDTMAVDCTTSNAAPIVDTVLGSALILLGTAVVVGGIGVATSSDPYFKSTEGPVVLVGAGVLGLGALSVASAATGYGRTADCRRMKETLPRPPPPSARFLLDVGALAHARAGADPAAPGP